MLLFVSPSATLTVTVAATPLSLQKTTLVGESTQGSNVDFTTQVVTAAETSQFQAAPSGTHDIPAGKASGSVVFESKIPGPADFTIYKNQEFDTPAGIKFFVTQDTPVFVPAPSSGTGSYSDPSNAVPVQDGTGELKGNVGSNTITVWPGTSNPCDSHHSPPPPVPCAPSDLIVTNPQPASGGTDATHQTVASDADLASWNNQVNALKQTLTAKVNSDMQNTAGSDIFALDPNGGGRVLTCDVNPPLPNSGDQFASTQISVSCHGKGSAFSKQDIHQVAINYLNAQKPQGEQLALDQCSIPDVKVNNANEDGHVVVNFPTSPSCFSTPVVQLDKSTLTCSTPDNARKKLQGQFVEISSVQIDETPFSLPFLPCFSSRISMNVNYVAKQSP